VWKVEHDGTDLGYIRYIGQNGLGTVEITNRQAALKPSHLELGGTTKTTATDQAGAHGEGLKVALLIMMRDTQNHQIYYRASGFQWCFNFSRRGKLIAELIRLSPKTMRDLRADAEEDAITSLLPFAADPADDVQVVIGEPGMGRDSDGHRVQRDQVRLTELQAWLKAALFLQSFNETHVLHTGNNDDIILDGPLRGNLYLKGLLLTESHAQRSASITGKELKYGYNFSAGQTNRERQSLAYATDEANAIQRIWDQLLGMKPAMISDLSDILNSKDPLYADVNKAKDYMSKDVIGQLRDYLLSNQFSNRWYFTADEKVAVGKLTSPVAKRK
jgi:hypothetical protein